MVDDDAHAALGILGVAEGEVDLGFGAAGRVGEVVVAHGDGGIGVERELLFAEADGGPGLEGEAVVFGYLAADWYGMAQSTEFDFRMSGAGRS